MKNFADFLKEEISIKKNVGIPEEKLREIERKGSEKVRGLHPGQIGGRLMELLGKSNGFITGKQQELQELAKSAVKNYFGYVLDKVDIEADLTRSGNEIGTFMKTQDKNNQERFDKFKKDLEEKLKGLKDKLKDKDLSNKEKQDCQDKSKKIEDYLSGKESEEIEKLDPEVVKLAVDKRKLMNNFIQGEAKNVKAILHLDEVKDGLKRIYGEAKGKEAFDTWDEMTKLADKLDWLLDPTMRAMQMERNPSGFAGAVSTQRPLPKFDEVKSDEEKEEEKKAKEEIIKKMEDGEIPKDSEEVRNALSKSVIRAKGVDFPMLLHELVKGVYEIITDVAMPSNKGLAKEVHKQTSSFADEAEDWKYGPYLAADLNDFIMKNPKASKHPNVKEYVFAKLIDRRRWTDAQCLENLKNIFLESPQGRKVIDMLIDEVVDSLDEYKRQLEDYEKKMREYEMTKKEEEEDEKYSKEMTAGETEKESEIDTLIRKSSERESSKDYSEMSQREIQALIDQALDDEDYEKVGMLSKYLKEGREIYLREIERINEKQNYHTRRNN